MPCQTSGDHHLSARCFRALEVLFEALIFAGANDESRFEFEATDLEAGLVGGRHFVLPGSRVQKTQSSRSDDFVKARRVG